MTLASFCGSTDGRDVCPPSVLAGTNPKANGRGCEPIRRVALRLLAAVALWSALTASPALSSGGGGDSGAIAVVTRVIDTLQKASPSDRAKATRTLRSSFDIEAIAKTIVGKYWSTASVRQKTEFMDALLSATVTVILERLEERRDLDLHIGKVRHSQNGDTLVATKVTKLNGRVVNILWRLRPCPPSLCVVDLIVDGASMAFQRRDEAAAILSANGGAIGELSLRLRAHPTHPFN